MLCMRLTCRQLYTRDAVVMLKTPSDDRRLLVPSPHLLCLLFRRHDCTEMSQTLDGLAVALPPLLRSHVDRTPPDGAGPTRILAAPDTTPSTSSPAILTPTTNWQGSDLCGTISLFPHNGESRSLYQSTLLQAELCRMRLMPNSQVEVHHQGQASVQQV